MKAKRVKLSNQVRQAVDACGVSRYRLSKATGLSQSQLSRFMAGYLGLSMHALDILADVLGMDVVARGPVNVPPLGQPGRKPKAKKGR
jgi:transcriptional regulator with XRE-family HTH domain